MWEAINTTYRAIPTGQFRALRPAELVPLGARPGGAHQRHRGRDDDPRRRVAVPGAGPLHRARRHDLATGRDRGARPRARGSVDQHAAGVRRVRGVPAHLQGPRDRPGVRRSSCSWTGCSRARWSSRSTVPSSAWTTWRPPASAPASTTRRSGCSGAPAPSWSTARSATSSPTSPPRWNGCNAPAPRPPRRSPRRFFATGAATNWQGVLRMSMQLRIIAHHPVRVRRQGRRVAQPGAAHPADDARPDRRAPEDPGVARRPGPTSTATTSATRSPPSRCSTRTSR